MTSIGSYTSFRLLVVIVFAALLLALFDAGIAVVVVGTVAAIEATRHVWDRSRVLALLAGAAVVGLTIAVLTLFF